MTMDKQKGAPAPPRDGGNRPHMITIMPPYLAGQKALGTIFPAISPLSQTLEGQHETIAHYKISSPDAILADLTLTGHHDFNLALLSTRADLVLMVIDATFGLTDKDVWSKALCCLAAIPDLVIAIDNMSTVDFSHDHFESLCKELNETSQTLECRSVHILPVNLATKDNLLTPADAMSWHDGPALRPLLDKLLSKTAPPPATKQAAQSSDQFAVYLTWVSKNPMLPGRQYLFEMQNSKTTAQISNLKYRLNPENMEHQAARRLYCGNVGYGNISLETAIEFDLFEENRKTGSFMLRDPQTKEPTAYGLIRHSLRRATNIRWQTLDLDKQTRAASKQQKPCVLWFTGLSGSGKSTVASLLEKKLHAMNKHTYVLDGDNVRHGLCRDLGFTDADRVENLRRISETARLFVDAGLIVLVSFISPFRSERQAAREKFDVGEFIEIFVDTPLEVCEARDVKGLYKKARAGRLKNFTGLDSPYEPPENAEIKLPGDRTTAQEMANMILTQLQSKDIV